MEHILESKEEEIETLKSHLDQVSDDVFKAPALKTPDLIQGFKDLVVLVVTDQTGQILL